MGQPTAARRFQVVDFAAIPGVPCPCGTARRAFADVPEFPATVHVTSISVDAQLHYHKRLTETYYVLECGAEARMQLDDETIFRRLAGAFYDAFTAQSDFARLAILMVYSHPQAARMLGDMVVKGRKRITEYVRKRQEEGYFCKHIEPGLLVQAIAAIFAMRAVGRGLEELLPYGYLPREEFINQLVSLLLYGMVRRDQLSSGEVEASA